MKSAMLLTIAAILVMSILLTSYTSGPKTPALVVKAAYLAANQGNYAEADKYLSISLFKVISKTKHAWDQVTAARTIEKIEILKEGISGNLANVHFKLKLNNGKNRTGEEILTKENGEWKITVN